MRACGFAIAVLLALLCTQLISRSGAAMAAAVERVGTAQQLQDAIDRGAEHVHVTEHLDLRELPNAPDPEDCGSACAPVHFWGPPALRSLTVCPPDMEAVQCACDATAPCLETLRSQCIGAASA